MTVLSDTDTLTAIREIASGPAAANADAVDHDARFPVEAVTALRDARALSAMVPARFGGAELPIRCAAEACFELGRHCAATAMVFAMHQIQVATIARHAGADSWFASYLERVADEQRLIASVTSEIGTGGDMGQSIAAIEPGAGARLTLRKQAPTVSYGAHADDLLTTVRRGPEADRADQVMVLHHASQTTLEPAGSWDTLGMRGTCSPGFSITAEFDAAQVLDVPFGMVMAESMVPISHILWSHVWLGIATAAFDRGHGFVRAAARRDPDNPPIAANQLAHVLASLQLLRSEVRSGLEDFERFDREHDRSSLSLMGTMLRFNNLKLASSEQTARVCTAILETIGIMAYKNDSPYSVGRHLRDSLSGRLMVANERLAAVDARWLTVAKRV